jgi:hypothetical protein
VPVWIDADFAQASSPIYAAFDDPTDDPQAWQNTGMQVADARHDRETAARLAVEWGANQ